MGKIIDGKAHAQALRDIAKKELELSGKNVTLVIFQAGDNPASNVYVRNKQKACEEVGIGSSVIKASSPEDLKHKIVTGADTCDAMMIQLPLPEEFGDPQQYIDLIPPEKDADCLTTYNLGKVFLGDDVLAPCTAYGIINLLQRERILVGGAHAVIVGRSDIVGKPIAHMLLNRNATVTVCHSYTRNLADITRMADILIVAVGKPKFITADMVKDGAVVIDVGINRMEDGKLCGDVDFDTVKEKASAITPVPGGVGPMTVAELLGNSIYCAEVLNND